MESFSETFRVPTDGVDRNGEATMPWFCRQLQQTAILHANRLSVGYDALYEKGLMWVLTRLWVGMNRYPRWGDDITVHTWPSGRSTLSWLRDFRITDGSAKEIGRATSLWLVVDRNTRRPRPAIEALDMEVSGAERVRSAELKTLSSIDSMTDAPTLHVGYFDVDVVGHINNVSYITWLLEALPHEWLRENDLRELEVSFLAEGFAGDALTPRIKELSAGRFAHALVKEADGKELCRARTLWAGPDKNPKNGA